MSNSKNKVCGKCGQEHSPDSVGILNEIRGESKLGIWTDCHKCGSCLLWKYQEVDADMDNVIALSMFSITSNKRKHKNDKVLKKYGVK